MTLLHRKTEDSRVDSEVVSPSTSGLLFLENNSWVSPVEPFVLKRNWPVACSYMGVQRQLKTRLLLAPHPNTGEVFWGMRVSERLIIYIREKDFQFSRTSVFIYFVLINDLEMKFLPKPDSPNIYHF